MRVVGVDSLDDQWNGSEDFGERRMLLVHTTVEFLQVADACADVRDFVHGNRFAPGGTAGENRHEQEQAECAQIEPEGSWNGHRASPLWRRIISQRTTKGD